MRIKGSMEEIYDMQAVAAFVIYTGNNRAVATHHEVEENRSGTLEIQPGHPASIQAFAEVVKLMIGEETPRTLLPARLLAHDSDFLLWYRPSQRRTIYFRTGNKSLDALDGSRALHPALLFMVQSLQLYVFALASDERPTAATRLYRAPYYNMYHSGLLCEGDFKMPDHYRLEGIEQWEQGFFDTSFAHTHMTPTDMTAHPNGHLGLWRELATDTGSKALKAFPTQHLVPLTELMVSSAEPGKEQSPPLTLGRVMEG